MIPSTIFDDKSLLIVDDNPESRITIMEVMLEYAPCLNIWQAPHGKAALAILAKKCPDLILLDWEMPVMNGPEMLDELSQNNQWNKIPVIMYTGAMTSPENLKTAMDKGVVDFLRKPANPIELVTRIRSILWQKLLEQKRLSAETELLNTKNTLLDKELALIKQELSSNLLILAQKNQALQSLREQCLIQMGKSSDKTKFQKIIRQIDDFLNGEDYWANFIVQFDKTDQNFSSKLLEKHPKLTHKEVQTCALIRLGLDNKSIAHLLNISNEGIKKKRYRIRKKMELEGSQELDTYLVRL